MTETITPFDIAEHLETDNEIREFLRETAISGDASDFIHALNVAARAKGMTEVARQAGVTRASLYKSLADDGNPRFDTIAKNLERPQPVKKAAKKHVRQIVLDTETTGLSPDENHRIIEIGCIEMQNRKITGQRFHVYLNPDREIDPGAIEVHGISNGFLADKPRFSNILDDFLEFVRGAELIIHNAPFDIGFINHELRLCGHKTPIEETCSVIDTLILARKKHPGQRNSLDALCKRYEIDNSHRQLHGALLDAEILADVYRSMTGGQTSLLADEPVFAERLATDSGNVFGKNRPRLKIIEADAAEIERHREYLERIQKESGGNCLWLADDFVMG
ncbi:MAG: DNA polymerase III subunit epsilon [Methylococcales bacterium]